MPAGIVLDSFSAFYIYLLPHGLMHGARFRQKKLNPRS